MTSTSERPLGQRYDAVGRLSVRMQPGHRQTGSPSANLTGGRCIGGRAFLGVGLCAERRDGGRPAASAVALRATKLKEQLAGARLDRQVPWL